MGDKGFEERTEPATPKRRQEARSEGRVAKSRELATTAVLLTGLVSLCIFAPAIYQSMTIMLQHWLSQVGQHHLQPAEVQQIFLQLSLTGASIMAPVMLTLTLAAIVANYLQVGKLFSWKAITPDFVRLNPLSGFKRLFSSHSLLELLKSLAKLILIGSIVYMTLKGEFLNLFPLLDQEVYQILCFMMRAAKAVFWRVILALFGLAVLDYAYQRYQYEKSLRMTKQEVKDEFRRTEGDPKVKARLRSLMRQLATKRMMLQVPQADVVVTNPTHYAVALKYDSNTMVAPQVVAKGKGYIALKIVALAEAAGVPKVANPDLAQALYRLVEIGEYIPVALYRAVAEILAHIYRQRGYQAEVT